MAPLSTIGQEHQLAFQNQLAAAANSQQSFESYIEPFFVCSMQVPLHMLWDHCFQQPLNINWVERGLETVIGNNICNADPKFALSAIVEPIGDNIWPISFVPGQATLDLLDNQYVHVVGGNHHYHYLLYHIAKQLWMMSSRSQS
jgi:hypothetical protein